MSPNWMPCEGDKTQVFVLELLVIVIVLANMYREFELWKDTYGMSFKDYWNFVLEE